MLLTGTLPLGKQPTMFSGFTVTGTLVRIAGLCLMLPTLMKFNPTISLILYISIFPLLIAAVIIQESRRI